MWAHPERRKLPAWCNDWHVGAVVCGRTLHIIHLVQSSSHRVTLRTQLRTETPGEGASFPSSTHARAMDAEFSGAIKKASSWHQRNVRFHVRFAGC